MLSTHRSIPFSSEPPYTDFHMVRPVIESELPDLKKLSARLKEGMTKYSVRLRFRDGRSENGAITFVERLGRGRLIDMDREFSMDFCIADLDGIDF